MDTLRIGIAGLGRLGYRHAENIAWRTPGATLAAACSLSREELERAGRDFTGAALYDDYAAMLQDQSLDAIFISTPSGLHCQQIEAALEAGFHVFSEKPLGVAVAECEQAERAVARHPEQVFMLGFMRRYDESYAYAKKLVDEGKIGKPFLVRAYGLDPEALIEGALRFAPTSGGIFLDMAVHDIDLANWFLGGQPESVYAIGGAFVHPEFAGFGDCDNACALLQYRDGGMAMLYSGRTAAHGYHIETEIVGSRGALRISPTPQKNLVQVMGSNGVLQECVGGFLERFQTSYLNELHEFVNCIRERRQPAVKAADGTLATRIAFAATKSYREKKVVRF
ncbi:MAG: Gfo/Idh/MocA family oxidoreductase [Chloroflexi bacterium]|nr:Gfo/Idh/MocA family oxidoreductase [Chloroflexota bacterium]